MLRKAGTIGIVSVMTFAASTSAFAADTTASTASTAQSIASEVVATAADADKTIVVKVGQMLTVKLAGTRGSGKYWRLNADLTPQLTLSGRTTNGLDAPGAAEETAYSFKTNKAGTLIFKASYLAPGAPLPKSDDIAFTVNIQS